MKKRYSEEQIIGFLREGEKGIAVKELCRRHGFSEASYYAWKAKYGGMDVSDAKRLKALEIEKRAAQEVACRIRAGERAQPRGFTKKMVTAPAKRELVRWMTTRGLSERRSLALVHMSASSLRYRRQADRNGELRQRIVALAQRHRRYGAGMIYLKLRQAGLLVNHKRVERLYALEQLQIKRRRRKKVPVGERQPLLRLTAANEVWSIDFAFDRVASGRLLKCLAVVDDATHEALLLATQHSIGGAHLTRLLDQLCAFRGKPAVIRSDNGPEFTGSAMLNWAHH